MKYAFILGTGDLTNQIVNTAKQKNLNFVVAGIKGVSSKRLVASCNHFWFYLGQVQTLLNNLKQHNVTHVVLVGAVKRPSLFALKVDSLGWQIIQQHLKHSFGDNSLLTKIIDVFAEYGFTVVGAQDIDDSIFVPKGYLTDITANTESQQDIKNGYKFAKEFSAFDVGQSIVYQQNVVVSIEALEGTANLIKRSKKLVSNTNPPALLIKVKKVHQDNRVDLPTIGLKTLKQCKASNIKGIVIEANSTIVLNKQQTINFANNNNIFIVAV